MAWVICRKDVGHALPEIQHSVWPQGGRSHMLDELVNSYLLFARCYLTCLISLWIKWTQFFKFHLNTGICSHKETCFTI